MGMLVEFKQEMERLTSLAQALKPKVDQLLPEVEKWSYINHVNLPFYFQLDRRSPEYQILGLTLGKMDPQIFSFQLKSTNPNIRGIKPELASKLVDWNRVVATLYDNSRFFYINASTSLVEELLQHNLISDFTISEILALTLKLYLELLYIYNPKEVESYTQAIKKYTAKVNRADFTLGFEEALLYANLKGAVELKVPF